VKVSLKIPPKGEKDQFSRDVEQTDWIFKFCGWIVLVGTLQYAAEVTGNGLFKGVAFGLTLQIIWLAWSFTTFRLVIVPFDPEGRWRIARIVSNAIVAGLIGFGSWQIASKVVATGVGQIVEFHKRAH
jgi:hypothetical protein